MKHFSIALTVLLSVSAPSWAQQDAGNSAGAETGGEEAAIRGRITAYVEAFNNHDAATLIRYWTADGVSVAEETGERTAGRDAIQRQFADFFASNSSARLSGEVSVIRSIRPDVAEVEGQTALFVGEGDPVKSAFTAVMVKEGDQWLISSSHERDLPSPTTSTEALKELEWLVGSWQDQSDDVRVNTKFRWSPNRAFLIRSFDADLGDENVFEGTQVIGWDPLGEQIRTWTFNSDGSFGQGTISRHDDAWMVKMWQVLADGRLANATRIMTRVDDDTMTVETIGQTIDGAPAPSLPPVKVVRVSDAATSATTKGETR